MTTFPDTISSYKRSAVLVILRSERGYLLLERGKDPHAGKYIPVGGKVEPGETPRAAAIREVQEEAGISVDQLRLAGILTETSPTDYNWIVHAFVTDVLHSEPISCNEGTLSWIDPARLDSVPIPEIDHFMYDFVQRGQFFVFDAQYDGAMRLAQLDEEIEAMILLSDW